MGKQNSCKTSIGVHSTMYFMQHNNIKVFHLLLVSSFGTESKGWATWNNY